MKTITLTQGYAALVDDGDYARLMEFKWQALVCRRRDGSVKNVYARTGGRPTLLMHREVMGANEPSVLIDHFPDHSGLNNQRNNLRVATRTENVRNSRLRTDSTSKFKGVSWHSNNQKFQASIKIDGKSKFLGYFTTAEEAAEARDIEALSVHGEFACTNASLGLR